MARIQLTVEGLALELDHCPRCRLVWFDRGELEQIPWRAHHPAGEPLEQAVARTHIQDAARERPAKRTGIDWSPAPPLADAPATPAAALAALGITAVPPGGWRRARSVAIPIVALVWVLVFALQLALSGSRTPLLTWIPGDVDRSDSHGFPHISARHTLMRTVSSMVMSLFAHADGWNLVKDLCFLVPLGRAVELRFGSIRVVGLLIYTTFFAALLHAFADPESTQPYFGADGAISGLIVAFALFAPFERVARVVPVVAFAAAWFVIVIVTGCISGLGASSSSTLMAHLGGVASGAVIGVLLRHGIWPARRTTSVNGSDRLGR